MISKSFISTPSIQTAYLHREDTGNEPVVFIHGNASSSVFWTKLIERLPAQYHPIAPDLRGYGNTEDLLIDATKGLRQFAEDILSLMDSLSIEKAHVIGHSMGGSVIFHLLGQAPNRFKSATLVNPGSPFGFGGTKYENGTPVFSDFAGSGAGVVNPEFARRISIGDRSTDDPLASPRVVMNQFYWKPPFRPDWEELLLDGLLSQRIGGDRYPGDFEPSANYPFTAPGIFGPANALSPKYIGNSVDAFIEKSIKIPILWIRGSEDQIVSDNSLFDMGTLGKMGLIPGYPGEEIYPSQPMVAQTRFVLQKRAAIGGDFMEIEMPDTGHSPFIEKEPEFCSYWFPFLQKHANG
jgi:pimeloyl-ACP methyl ester carboxylesterase